MMANGRFHWRISVVSWRLMLTVLLWLGGTTLGLTAEADSSPLQPVDTSSPRSTFLAFRENTEAAYRRWRLRESRQEAEVEMRRAVPTLGFSPHREGPPGKNRDRGEPLFLRTTEPIHLA